MTISQNTSHLVIRGLGPKGDGIHSAPGRTIFVDRAVPGDRILGNIRRDESGIWRADLVEIIEASRFRQMPPCVHYDRCGNCTLQHLSESFYRRWKVDLVREAFRKNGLVPKTWLEPLFLAGRQKRRRLTFAAYKWKGKVTLGFYPRRSHRISDIDSCLVADPALWSLREKIEPLLNTLLSEAKTAEVFLQLAGDKVDMLVTSEFSGDFAARTREAAVQLIKATNIKRVGARTGAKEGGAIRILAGQGPITAVFGGLSVDLPPDAFLQATSEGEAALVNAVLTALPTKGRFADLFSGCGTFSGPLLSRGSVDAYESSAAAVSALTKAAHKQSLRAFRRDLFHHPLRRDELNRYDAIVFDPPRAGCGEQATQMAAAQVRTLVGVSCNPATFARDAQILFRGGYRLKSLQVIDQFLWSHHVEVVGVFTKGRR